MVNIFLYGEMGTGKDTVGDYLAEHHEFYSIALADGIRKYICENDIYYQPKTDRALEIEVGEQHRAWFGKDYWCRRAIEEIEGYTYGMNLMAMGPVKGVIVKDGRYPHEYEFFVNQCGYVPVKLVAPHNHRKERLMKRDGEVNLTHFYDKRDMMINDLVQPAEFVLLNDGTPDELYAAIDEIIAVLGGER